MKVCLILEGCYPFIRGGVSAWAHQYITNSPEIEFVLWTVHAAGEDVKEPLYVFPENVTEHRMIILEEDRKERRARKTDAALWEKTAEAMYRLLFSGENSADELTGLLRSAKMPVEGLMRSEALLDLARRISDEIPELGLADAFYSLQSMFKPICKILTAEIPDADIYHAAVTGYGGMLGAMAAMETGKPFILTEHGIYPREREEELIATDWTVPAVRPLWIRLFYEMSRFAYSHASKVTSLFENARDRQIAIGCAADKCVVIPNGIPADRFSSLPEPENRDTLHLGAFVRFAEIKDLKTLIRAFYAVKQKEDHLILHIMGGTDDEDYRRSCEVLIDRFGLRDSTRIEGHVDAVEYMRMMDMTILTSISEGQPLTILESMAAGRPCIATRVGDCEGLIEGETEGAGAAGICCTPMCPEEIADAILRLCRDPELRRNMGKNGKKRVWSRYLLSDMLRAYHEVYREVM